MPVLASVCQAQLSPSQWGPHSQPLMLSAQLLQGLASDTCFYQLPTEWCQSKQGKRIEIRSGELSIIADGSQRCQCTLSNTCLNRRLQVRKYVYLAIIICVSSPSLPSGTWNSQKNGSKERSKRELTPRCDGSSQSLCFIWVLLLLLHPSLLLPSSVASNQVSLSETKWSHFSFQSFFDCLFTAVFQIGILSLENKSLVGITSTRSLPAIPRHS